MIELTDEQRAAVDAAARWYETCMTTLKPDGRWDTRPFRLFGPAGTGKTTLARDIAEALGLDHVAYGAYTGKAASVLRSKGMPATTIHSAIYRPFVPAALREEWEELRAELAEQQAARDDPEAAGWAGALELAGAISETSERIEQIEQEMKKPGFEFNPECEWADADLIVLDEVSMVDTKMATEIESLGVPVLVLGDPAQLPPVGGAGYYIDAEPDVLLTKIHRQSEESPVLRLATAIRLGQAHDATYETASVTRAMDHDQVLCWRNATRWKLIERMRAKVGKPAGVPVAGDRVMCLVNNKKDLGIFNGQQFEVLDVDKFDGPDGEPGALLLAEIGAEGPDRWISAFPEGFQGAAGEATLKDRRAFRGNVGAFTFADAITVHKAQGSEWGSVYLIDETLLMLDQTARRAGRSAAELEARRWLYTGVTRARDTLTLARLRG